MRVGYVYCVSSFGPQSCQCVAPTPMRLPPSSSGMSVVCATGNASAPLGPGTLHSAAPRRNERCRRHASVSVLA